MKSAPLKQSSEQQDAVRTGSRDIRATQRGAVHAWKAGLVWLLLAATFPLAADWPRWRGPNIDGISIEQIGLSAWPPGGPAKLWTNSVGTGFSSIAVSQGRVFTLGNSNDTDVVFCFSAETGAVVWTHSYPCPLDPNLHEGGPSATPTVDGDRVYTLSKFGHLFCFDAATGKIRWQKNLITDFSVEKPEWGFAGSPLIEGDRLILNAGDHGLALDKTNGSLRWLSGTARTGYSSPVPYTHEGVRAVLLFGRRSVVSAAIQDGRVLWSHFWATQFDMNIADPILFNGDFFITSYNRPATRLNVLGNSTAAVWQNRNLSTVLSPGVVVGDHLYAFHDVQSTPAEGELRCLDLRTGDLAWTKPMRVGSLISADNKLIILTGDGDLVLAETNPSAYVEISRAKVLQGRCWTMPALSDGRLYCRNAVGHVVVVSLAAATAGLPNLQITRATGSNRVRLVWLSGGPELQLETTDRLSSSAVWTAVAATPKIEENKNVIETDLGAGDRFFRLRKR